MVEKICRNKNCGKKFMSSQTYKFYCCDKCRKDYRDTKRKDKKKRIEEARESSKIREINDKAKQQGMSYGNYVSSLRMIKEKGNMGNEQTTKKECGAETA